MRRIAVISDTHWSKWDETDHTTGALLTALCKGFHEIWHAGDVVHESILTTLEECCPVTCVKGNCDTFFGRNLPHQVEKQIEGVTIGMIHGWDLPLSQAAFVREAFDGEPELIIHGHTHKQRFELHHPEGENACTIINPGSVSSPRGGDSKGYGELVINGSAWSYVRHELG